MIGLRNVAIKILSIPSAAYTAGTSFTVAHGLGYAPALNSIMVCPRTPTATGTDDVTDFGVESADATNITLKPSRTKTASGHIWVWSDVNQTPNQGAQ